MIKQFEMTDMGLMSYFLEIEVFQSDYGIFISQKKYACDILKKFKIITMKPIMTPVKANFILTKEGIGLISRFMKNPCQSYLQAAKRILRYIGSTRSDIIFIRKLSN